MTRSADPEKRARQAQNLLKGVSANPETRARQVSHLRRRHVHGAQGGEQLENARERHEQALLVDYPGLDGRRRALLADRLARIELAAAFVTANGLGPTGKGDLGEVWAITDRLEQWAARAESLVAAAEAEKVRGGRGNVESLAEYVERVHGGGDDAA